MYVACVQGQLCYFVLLDGESTQEREKWLDRIIDEMRSYKRTPTPVLLKDTSKNHCYGFILRLILFRCLLEMFFIIDLFFATVFFIVASSPSIATKRRSSDDDDDDDDHDDDDDATNDGNDMNNNDNKDQHDKNSRKSSTNASKKQKSNSAPSSAPTQFGIFIQCTGPVSCNIFSTNETAPSSTGNDDVSSGNMSKTDVDLISKTPMTKKSNDNETQSRMYFETFSASYSNQPKCNFNTKQIINKSTTTMTANNRIDTQR
jgi:hypothetical protein